MQRRALILGLGMLAILAAFFAYRELPRGISASALGTEALALFPPSPIPFSSSSQTTVSEQFSSSGSTWRTGLDEQDVFQALISHASSDPSQAWQLRIGKGGQVYSLRTPAGEAIPPQGRPDADWVDSVFQIVATDFEKSVVQKGSAKAYASANNIPSPLYALQAGTYLDASTTSAFYSPVLASGPTPDGKGYATLNWYQEAHIPSPYTSGLLLYTEYRDAGNGVIEVTSILYNFGNSDGDTLDYFNLPWDIVRVSTYPAHFLSDATGGITQKEGTFQSNQREPVSQTGGWAVYTDDNPNASSNALGIVFGKELPDSSYRYGTGFVNDPGGALDQFISTVISRTPLTPGNALLYRYYLVVGTYAEVQSEAPSLVADTVLQPISFDSATDPRVSLPAGTGYSSGCAFAYPAPDYTPLFLLQNAHTGESVATTNPYALSSSSVYNGQTIYQPYDGNTKYLGILGFVPKNASGCGN